MVTGGFPVHRQGGEAVAEGRTVTDAEGEACWADAVAGRLAAEEQPSPTADAGALATSALLSAQVKPHHTSSLLAKRRPSNYLCTFYFHPILFVEI